MKDPQIRQLLLDTELAKYRSDPHSRIVEELNLPVAHARIDMAVVNGHFHGYEIKSASDTLQRLPSQIEAYSKVFDYLTVITEHKHYQKVLNILPKWVGLSICMEDGSLAVIQPSEINENKVGFFIAKLLWRDEIIELLQYHNIAFKKKQRNWLLCEILSDNLSIEDLSSAVRTILKKRNNWKLD